MVDKYNSRKYKSNKQKNNKKKYNLFLTKILLCIIIILCSLIYTNFSDINMEKFKKNILEKNISFTKFNKIYDKYFGSLVKEEEEMLTFNEDLTYKEIKPYNEGFELSVDTEYMVPFLSSGIIVFSGEKENFGSTIIVQGNDGVDIWYGNVTLLEYSLYDYVSAGEILGVSNSNKIYLDFIKDGEHISYDEYIS